MSVEDDRYYYEQEAAMEAFLEESLRNISEENVRWYLGTYGDAIEERVKECLRQAKELHDQKYYGPSIILSTTANEIIIRYMLLRPLVQGAFLSDEWAEILSKRVATGRSSEDREILPAILKQWEIDITSIKLSNAASLWESILRLWRKRNEFIHIGEPISYEDAQTAMECVETLLNEVVLPISINLGFTLKTTGKWCKIDRKTEYGSYGTSFTPKTPF